MILHNCGSCKHWQRVEMEGLKVGARSSRPVLAQVRVCMAFTSELHHVATSCTEVCEQYQLDTKEPAHG